MFSFCRRCCFGWCSGWRSHLQIYDNCAVVKLLFFACESTLPRNKLVVHLYSCILIVGKQKECSVYPGGKHGWEFSQKCQSPSGWVVTCIFVSVTTSTPVSVLHYEWRHVRPNHAGNPLRAQNLKPHAEKLPQKHHQVNKLRLMHSKSVPNWYLAGWRQMGRCPSIRYRRPSNFWVSKL